MLNLDDFALILIQRKTAQRIVVSIRTFAMENVFSGLIIDFWSF